jgi:hypothetical protein
MPLSLLQFPAPWSAGEPPSVQWRSALVTTKVSTSRRWAKQSARSGRSRLMPLAFLKRGRHALILASWVSELQIGGGNAKVGNKVSFAAVTGALRSLHGMASGLLHSLSTVCDTQPTTYRPSRQIDSWQGRGRCLAFSWRGKVVRNLTNSEDGRAKVNSLSFTMSSP